MNVIEEFKRLVLELESQKVRYALRFDVFISCRQTDDNGSSTRDGLLTRLFSGFAGDPKAKRVYDESIVPDSVYPDGAWLDRLLAPGQGNVDVDDVSIFQNPVKGSIFMINKHMEEKVGPVFRGAQTREPQQQFLNGGTGFQFQK